MASKNKLIGLILTLLTLSYAEAKIVLPEMMTKQAINNIRFLSQNGKYTYYQKRSGSLLFSTNYKVQEMLKGEIGTEYNVFATPSRKKMVILQNPNFQNFYSLRAKQKIYVADFGASSAREVGLGIAPQLLLNDEWLSYYDPYLKIINFENTLNSALKFSIRLNNRINPYFLPNVVMSDDNTVYYTDIGDNGAVGLLEFKRNIAKSDILFKAQTPMIKVEICLVDDKLIFGQFGIHGNQSGSIISSIELPLKDFNKRESVYQSDLNDLGHLVCNYEKGHLAFIKNVGIKTNPGYDIAELSLSTKKIEILTDLGTVSNIINMDGTLLTQERGKYFIVKGEADYKNVDTLKAKPDATKIQQSESKIKEEAVEKDLENE